VPARPLTAAESANARVLQDASSSFAYLFLTETALKKSILDATEPVRALLHEAGVHDYAVQGRGPEARATVECLYYHGSTVMRTQASLYRPRTKQGDPRIWIYALSKNAGPDDVLAVTPDGLTLHVFNLSSIPIEALGAAGPAGDFLARVRQDDSRVAVELLSALRALTSRGPLPAQGSGDTAVGRTLEWALGISMNSSQLPDYKGIEIKSFRSGRANRKTLFAQVPDWSISRLKSSAAILAVLGYERDGIRKYYNTVSSVQFNAQGVRLRVDDSQDRLVEYSREGAIGDVVAWRLSKLHQRLVEKHRETFWVEADSARDADGRELFVFRSAEHTRRPVVAQFDVLLATGAITVDHLIKEIARRTNERGPLFKISSTGLTLLFPPSQRYEL
jgi:hypothetical protein